MTEGRRAFTMLELLVGLAISTVVMTAVTLVYAQATNEQRQQRIRNQLAQDGAAFERQFNSEMRVVGMGRPRGGRIDNATEDLVDNVMHVVFSKAAGASSFSEVDSTRTISADSAGDVVALMVVADVPRPDANFETFSLLSDRPVGVNRVSFINDHTGTCAPTSPATCNAGGVSSLLFPNASGSECNAVLDRGCAWGGKRLRGGDVFQIMVGDGSYANVEVTGALTMNAAGAAGGRQLALNVAGAGANKYPSTRWPNTALGDAPTDVRGQGFVTTLDRVSYRYCPAAIVDFGTARTDAGATCNGPRMLTEGRVIERRQCWGAVDPDDSNWTSLSSPNGVCTPWEPVLRDVDRVEFQFDDMTTSNPLMPRQISYRILLARRYGKDDVTKVIHSLRGSIRLRNVR
jgi:prepilin-type N-terminal cleavage/methylation domain-containing protein